MIIHYNCTIGSILLHSFLLIYHPYPPSFHEMIFILVNECARSLHNCHSNAGCINTLGSFQCQCDSGYEGSGIVCTGKAVICQQLMFRDHAENQPP